MIDCSKSFEYKRLIKTNILLNAYKWEFLPLQSLEAYNVKVFFSTGLWTVFIPSSN